MHCSTAWFLPNKVFVTDSIFSQVGKIARGLDMVFQVISFSTNDRMIYFKVVILLVCFVVLLILTHSFFLMLKNLSLMGILTQ